MANNEIAFVDGIIAAVEEILLRGADMLHTSVLDVLPFAVGVTIRTPHPSPSGGLVFGQPTSEPWISLYSYYTEVVLPITLLLLVAGITIMMFSGTLGGLLSGYERSLTQRRLFLGFLFVFAWWAAGTLTLQFADGLATSIAPDVTTVAESFTSALDPGAASGGPVMRAGLTAFEALVVLGMAFLYLLRWVGIYALMLGMPIAVALWVVNVGPFAYLSRIVEGLAAKFIPLAFVSVPVAVIFRVGDLLFSSNVPIQGFGHPIAPFVLALGFPMMSIFVGYYVVFKTPSIRRMSREATPAVRETIEKGRAEPMGDGRMGNGSSVYTGRESPDRGDTDVVTGRREYDVARGGGAQRLGRSYETIRPSGAGGSSVNYDLEHSREKIRDIRRNSKE